jgi:hypothetical protein
MNTQTMIHLSLADFVVAITRSGWAHVHPAYGRLLLAPPASQLGPHQSRRPRREFRGTTLARSATV